MGHDWIFDVLRDLISYAQANGLPAVAAKAEETLKVAKVEVAGLSAGPAPKGGKHH